MRGLEYLVMRSTKNLWSRNAQKRGQWKKSKSTKEEEFNEKWDWPEKKQSKGAATILYYQYRYDFFQITRLWQWFLNIYYKLNLKYFCKDLSELADVCQKWLSIIVYIGYGLFYEYLQIKQKYCQKVIWEGD